MKPQVWVSKHGATPNRESIEPVANCEHWKPQGGMWTSSLVGKDQSGWLEWLRVEGYLGDPGWCTSAWLLTPAPSRILEIIGADQVQAAMHLYERREAPFHSRSFEWFDWEAMARDFDAVTFPDPWTDRFASMFLYGLDAESTIWFRWCFQGEPVLLHEFTEARDASKP